MAFEIAEVLDTYQSYIESVIWLEAISLLDGAKIFAEIYEDLDCNEILGVLGIEQEGYESIVLEELSEIAVEEGRDGFLVKVLTGKESGFYGIHWVYGANIDELRHNIAEVVKREARSTALANSKPPQEPKPQS